jgi:acyl phosphate:glycerol-3-phosphate acyltransferase
MEGNMLLPALLTLAAYLFGSIPSSVWAGKWFFGIDVRDHGSGNAGATNAFRVLGAKTASVVMVVDVLKAVAAVSLAGFVKDTFISHEWFRMYQYLLGVAAVLGHVFPVFAGFRGGKGIATLAGTGLVLFPIAVSICLAVFILVFMATRYVSLGSMLAALSFPVIVIFFSGEILISEIVFSLLVAVFVPLTHIKNIKRLVAGTENKIIFRKTTPKAEIDK